MGGDGFDECRRHLGRIGAVRQQDTRVIVHRGPDTCQLQQLSSGAQSKDRFAVPEQISDYSMACPLPRSAWTASLPSGATSASNRTPGEFCLTIAGTVSYTR